MDIKDYITGYEKVVAKSIINNMIREWLKVDNSDIGIVVLHQLITAELKDYLSKPFYKGTLTEDNQSDVLNSFINLSTEISTVNPIFPDK